MTMKKSVFYLSTIFLLLTACSAPAAALTKVQIATLESPSMLSPRPTEAPEEIQSVAEHSAEKDQLLLSGVGGVYLTNSKGENPFSILSEEVIAALSPDGKRVAYFLDGFVYVLDLSSGQAHRIHSEELGNLPPSGMAWSPDQKKIGFDCIAPNKKALDICILEMDTTNESAKLKILTDSEQFGAAGMDGTEFGAWNQDGTKIVYMMRILPPTDGHASGTLQIIDINSGAIQTIFDEKDNQEISRISGAAWGPNDQWLVFGGKVGETYAIFRIDMDGQDLSRITSAEYAFDISNPLWPPEGDTFFAFAQDQNTSSVRGVPTLFSPQGTIIDQLDFEGMAISWIIVP